MKKALAILSICFVLTSVALANKTAQVRFRSKSSSDQVYTAALRAISLQGYAVRFTDPKQGTIQANKAEWGGHGDWASVIITIRQEGESTIVDAIFTRNLNTVRGGQPPKWAEKFGDELKKTILDLERES